MEDSGRAASGLCGGVESDAFVHLYFPLEHGASVLQQGICHVELNSAEDNWKYLSHEEKTVH